MSEKIDLIEKFAEIVEQFLASLNLNLTGFDYFPGGSRRFGYHTKTSDVDFFVYYNDLSILAQELTEYGFERDCRELHYPTILYTFRNIIHIGVYTDKHQFLTEKERNNRVARYLTANPEIGKILKLITLRSTERDGVRKVFSYSGTELFNLIDDLAFVFQERR